MSNEFPLIVVDESTDARITEALIHNGYSIFSIQEILPGTEDIDIIKLAGIKNAFILTEDRDFGDELVFKKSFHYGAMLLRLPGVPIEEKIRLVLTALKNHEKDLANNFAVLSKRKLRIRK